MLPLANALFNKGCEIVTSIEKAFRRCGKEREIIKYEDECEKIARIRNTFSQKTELSDPYKKTYGFFGEVLADALPSFALDVVGVIAEYAMGRGDELSKSLRTEIEKAGTKKLAALSSEVESRLQEEGPSTPDLDLSFDTKSSLFIDVGFLKRYLLTNVTALRSLKISCTVMASKHLHEFPNLQQLEITNLGQYKGNREKLHPYDASLLDQSEAEELFDLEENENVYSPISGDTLDKELQRITRWFRNLKPSLSLKLSCKVPHDYAATLEAVAKIRDFSQANFFPHICSVDFRGSCKNRLSAKRCS